MNNILLFKIKKVNNSHYTPTINLKIRCKMRKIILSRKIKKIFKNLILTK